MQTRNNGRLVFAALTCVITGSVSAQTPRIKFSPDQQLTLPVLSKASPSAGRFVAVTSPEYEGTEVFHTVYLPIAWRPDGEPLPIIFEYTGNRFPQSGSTGKVEDAGLGFGLSGGQFIWVSLPYVNEQGTANEVTWWGDEKATIEYAKVNVPRIITKFNANPDAVFLCGFSRGAIGVNYIGLHDDEIAELWTAFITHDHFDGVREWRSNWGSPLERYQEAAKQRLERVNGRPYWVSQNGKSSATEPFIRSAIKDSSSFTFGYVPVREILGDFPNVHARTSHTDRWPLVPSCYRDRIRDWMCKVAGMKDEASEGFPPSLRGQR